MITLEEFIKQEQVKLQSFEAYWRKNEIIKPELFPSELLAGDWDEMLAIYSEEE
ncbi:MULTISPECIES: hypothetical protein [Photobacterium]|jgi:hypothetical protein|uniref:hypothetical protein n=1 Tax=Photobacterium TaxID=657 RepID=UPI000B16FE03|nr:MULTISPECIES: hypothetical protein [Photobacterium]MBY3789348.1 hypothetical protein [Photobacterium carnosum]MCD9480765.1 hypothetical protein [Photobacterium phosphoreum]MCD9502178.1 hypothetical protein [Photobacterium phosphoreum]MCD9512353.1 hypothetical protein [Photobacterium phosphoreum]MCD9534407.1 hypothetical protein [Photobacterium carnosum]